MKNLLILISTMISFSAVANSGMSSKEFYTKEKMPANISEVNDDQAYLVKVSVVTAPSGESLFCIHDEVELTRQADVLKFKRNSYELMMPLADIASIEELKGIPYSQLYLDFRNEAVEDMWAPYFRIHCVNAETVDTETLPTNSSVKAKEVPDSSSMFGSDSKSKDKKGTWGN